MLGHMNFRKMAVYAFVCGTAALLISGGSLEWGIGMAASSMILSGVGYTWD